MSETDTRDTLVYDHITNKEVLQRTGQDTVSQYWSS